MLCKSLNPLNILLSHMFLKSISLTTNHLSLQSISLTENFGLGEQAIFVGRHEIESGLYCTTNVKALQTMGFCTVCVCARCYKITDEDTRLPSSCFWLFSTIPLLPALIGTRSIFLEGVTLLDSSCPVYHSLC